MLAIVTLLFILALILLWQARRRANVLGLPAGRIIYADTQKWAPVEEPLYDASLGLTGRPDYLIQDGETIIPVEVKSNRVSSAPYDSHIFQLAAYCLLVECVYGIRPPHGILHYANRTFAVDYTIDLESALLDILKEMRTDERRRTLPRSHDNPARCRGCGYRSLCDQALR